jgi:hypothetical protein
MRFIGSGFRLELRGICYEWANAAQDDAELVDVEWCSSGSHALRVAQSIGPLKGSPRYLALS